MWEDKLKNIQVHERDRTTKALFHLSKWCFFHYWWLTLIGRHGESHTWKALASGTTVQQAELKALIKSQYGFGAFWTVMKTTITRELLEELFDALQLALADNEEFGGNLPLWKLTSSSRVRSTLQSDKNIPARTQHNARSWGPAKHSVATKIPSYTHETDTTKVISGWSVSLQCITDLRNCDGHDTKPVKIFVE